MKEIRFLKDLPCKLTNSNKSVINLLGGDIYYDRDGNRFAFLTFENLNKSPIFFLQLAIREYSSEGKLIKDQEFILPYLYAPKGQFVNDTPIEIDQETEAVEVCIVKATFDRENFESDRLSPFRSEDYAKKPSRAPAKRWDSKSSVSFVSGSAETTGTSGETVASSDSTVEAGLEEGAVREEAVAREDLSSLPRGTYTKKKKALFFLPLGAIVVLAIVAIVIFTFYSAYFVNTANGYI